LVEKMEGKEKKDMRYPVIGDTEGGGGSIRGEIDVQNQAGRKGGVWGALEWGNDKPVMELLIKRSLKKGSSTRKIWS